ncbi:hypothetical protein ACFQXA_12790 [Nocardiopsis composta]
MAVDPEEQGQQTMAEPNGRDTGAGARRNGEDRENAASADIIDDALRLVDALQRKLIVAGVRKGVSAATSPPPRTGDVWEEAIRAEQPQPEEPPLDRFVGVVRTAAPEIAGHLGRAGAALFGALGETWRIVEGEFERQRREGEARGEGAGAEDRPRPEVGPGGRD